ANALRALRAADGPGRYAVGDSVVDCVEVRCPRPDVRVGLLALTRFPAQARVERDEGEDEETGNGPSAAFEGLAHHIVLLRDPELVVDYDEGLETLSIGTEWAGVFKADEAVDDAFARAEPPTHDAWESKLVPAGRERRYVHFALLGLREEAERFVGPGE